jgi:hypothetical protein
MRYGILFLLTIFLAACNTTPKPDRVEKITEYVGPPDEFLVCEGVKVLTLEERNSIKTETQYNLKFVQPNLERLKECADNAEAVREWKSKLK